MTAGCGSSSNPPPPGTDAVDPTTRAAIREAVEAYPSADDTDGEEALFARVDGEWKDVPFAEFEAAVRDRAPIELRAGLSSAQRTASGTKKGKYFQHVPAALAGEQTALPLIVFLHGLDQTGAVIAEDRTVQAAVDALGAVLVAPTSEAGCAWSMSEDCAWQVATLVQHLERVLPVDPDRVVLTGYSMGGRSSLSLGAAYPGAFAGMVAGAGTIGSSIRNSPNPRAHKPDVCPHTENFDSTRVWLYVGEHELPQPANLIAQNAGIGACLTEQGGVFRFAEIPGLGHRFRARDWRPGVRWALEEPRVRYPSRAVYHLRRNATEHGFRTSCDGAILGIHHRSKGPQGGVQDRGDA